MEFIAFRLFVTRPLDVTEAIIKGILCKLQQKKEPLQFDLLKRQSDDNSVDTFDVVLCEETEKRNSS
jgi:hypothetical protein